VIDWASVQDPIIQRKIPPLSLIYAIIEKIGVENRQPICHFFLLGWVSA
jgi:hypothetical protein